MVAKFVALPTMGAASRRRFSSGSKPPDGRSHGGRADWQRMRRYRDVTVPPSREHTREKHLHFSGDCTIDHLPRTGGTRTPSHVANEYAQTQRTPKRVMHAVPSRRP